MQQDNDKQQREKLNEAADSLFDGLKNSEMLHKASEWLHQNKAKIDSLLDYPILRDYVFEPIKGVFNIPDQDDKHKARVIITQVALVNAVIAGLPGSLGVGVYICIALELWMAYALSQAVGLTMSRDEVIKTLSAWAVGAGAILLLFKQGLNLVFPFITALMPFAGPGTALTQLVVTNMFGVLLWIMFEEMKTNRNFRFPLTSSKRLADETTYLLQHQWKSGAPLLKPKNWKEMGMRLKSWLTGDIATDMPRLRGELVATVALAWLLAGQHDKLTGALGEEFIGAIKDRFPDLANADIGEIAAAMGEYDAEQIPGLVNLIKGKLFERLVARHENADDDQWQAMLHDDEFYPGSDLTLTHDNGDMMEVSLKASDNKAYLEKALLDYPQYPIIATDEVVALMSDNDLIWASGITNEELTRVTEQNLEHLMQGLNTIDAMQIASAATLTQAAMSLWPFTVAYMRGKINKQQLGDVCRHVFPEIGETLAARLVFAAVLGPVYAWWLLAKGVLAMTKGETANRNAAVKRLVMR